MTTSEAVERLRQKAKDYELSAQAAAERGALTEATTFTAIGITIFEVADCLDEEGGDPFAA